MNYQFAGSILAKHVVLADFIGICFLHGFWCVDAENVLKICTDVTMSLLIVNNGNVETLSGQTSLQSGKIHDLKRCFTTSSDQPVSFKYTGVRD